MEKKLQGFVISDWQGIDRITNPPHANYTYSVQASIEAGVDMVMVPYNYTEFIDTLLSLVKSKVIPMSRINDAVRRILRVKFQMGLFENPLADDSFADQIGSQVISLFTLVTYICKLYVYICVIVIHSSKF